MKNLSAVGRHSIDVIKSDGEGLGDAAMLSDQACLYTVQCRTYCML
jgi:hypothetical protein